MPIQPILLRRYNHPTNFITYSYRLLFIITSNYVSLFFYSVSPLGSSWTAYKVTDDVYMGGETPESVAGAGLLSIPFTFGCQEVEQGLFRTQHVDGIMGLSAKVDTFPFQLKRGNLTKTKRFSLCFRPKGGYLTLAAPSAKSADINSPAMSKPPINYIPLTKGAGWYTVKLVDILMYVPAPSNTNTNSNLRGSTSVMGTTSGSNVVKESIGATTAKFNAGKGVIIDSGTTDTYLPSSIRQNFETMFTKLTKGISYSNSRMTLTDEQFRRLPVIVYRFTDKFDESKFVDVETHPYSYSEKTRSSKITGGFDYVFRIYLTEGNGAVLGSNFMNYHNIEFDIEKSRVGIQPDSCHFKPPNPSVGRLLESEQTSEQPTAMMTIDYDENIQEFESFNFWESEHHPQNVDEESSSPQEGFNVMARRRLIVDDAYNATLDHMYRNSRHVYEYPSVASTASVSVTEGLMGFGNYSYRQDNDAYIGNLTFCDSAYTLQSKPDIATSVELYYSSCVFFVIFVIVVLFS